MLLTTIAILESNRLYILPFVLVFLPHFSPSRPLASREACESSLSSQLIGSPISPHRVRGRTATSNRRNLGVRFPNQPFPPCSGVLSAPLASKNTSGFMKI